MATGPVEQAIGAQLAERRGRISRAIEAGHDVEGLVRLLGEVDGALERLGTGSFGICEGCHEPIEAERLLGDPLAHTCLECLSAAEQRSLEGDLELASRVQARLLPPRRMQRDGWHLAYEVWPAGPVGGDLCDVVPHADGFTVLVGDVAGKGVAAALLGAHLHALARTLLAQRPPLPELVSDINRFLNAGTLSTHYVTLVAADVGPDGAVRLVNAGHCLPLVVRAGEVVRLPSTGLPVGLFEGASYDICSLSLGPGDSLLLYTDGVTEALDGTSCEYGIDRLAEAASRGWGQEAAAMLASCLGEHRQFVGDARRTDDLTMLALSRSA